MYGINLITIETDIANEITGIGNELFLGEDRAALTGVAMIAFRAEIEKYGFVISSDMDSAMIDGKYTTSTKDGHVVIVLKEAQSG